MAGDGICPKRVVVVDHFVSGRRKSLPVRRRWALRSSNLQRKYQLLRVARGPNRAPRLDAAASFPQTPSAGFRAPYPVMRTSQPEGTRVTFIK